MQNKYLNRYLETQLHPAMIAVDGEGRLLDWEGNLQWYDLHLNREMVGKRIDTIIPFLVGINFSTELTWPFMTFGADKTADIHVQPLDLGGANIFFIESRQLQAVVQETQQEKNETTLLYNKLQQLSAILKDKNTALQHAINARNQFLSGISHEFRTPITTILGHNNLLISRCSHSDESINRSVQSIDKNAKYLLALIDNLLEQGGITADRLTLSNSIVALNEFFHFILDTFSVAAEEKQLEFHCNTSFEDNARILIDEHYLYLMLVNLITNAIKFTDHGFVKVTATWSDGMLSIKVRDSGIGIPESDLEKIRQPFSRAGNVGNRRGSGLGLSIINEVVKAMHGNLSIQSTTGEGTSVTLNIPAERHDVPETGTTRENATHTAEEPVILIIEDDPDISALYTIILKDSAGMQPICYESGDHFLENIANHNPDIIILDYNLVDENGVILAQMARDHGYQKPIILLTATSSIDSRLSQDALAAGCTRVLNKPRDVNSLATIIRTELSNQE